MARKSILDDEEIQEIFLGVLRNTGFIQKACYAVGLSPQAVINYRNKNPDFDSKVKYAKLFTSIKNKIEYDIQVRNKAWKRLEKRIDDGTISDSLLAKSIEGFKIHSS